MSKYLDLINYLPNDLINYIFKFVGPSPTAKLIKNKYIAYEPSTFNNIIDKEYLKYEKRYEMIRYMNIIECHINQRIFLFDQPLDNYNIVCDTVIYKEYCELGIIFMNNNNQIVGLSSYNRKIWDYFYLHQEILVERIEEEEQERKNKKK